MIVGWTVSSNKKPVGHNAYMRNISNKKTSSFPFEKERSFQFEQNFIPFAEVCFVLIWLKLAQWFWRRTKIYDIDDDDGQRTNFDQKCPL